ncbi:electron transporter SenC [Limisphaera ngatamarikiensis]|uniref:Electron transporter SenC n=1 Tax=Limisphaera ngatamarikiensis TaxID=1324935 RepID=A0A6M1RZT6_9BACT|nr:SCO family protein [Limisphaera ngatamarikiensis]NGO38630.1 electron transporter SenC [Limisphaera ngatamarikiensis]
MNRNRIRVWACCLALGLAGCSRDSQPLGPAAGPPLAPRHYEVRGVVIELDPARSNLLVRHEEIPGYMRAMTMPFAVRDTNLLAGLASGDSIRFRLVVTETDGWIETLEKVNTPATNRLPLTGPFRLVRDVDPLQPGDLLPHYPLTNQWGQPFSTTNFHGRVLVLSFIYTRCPFPTFCPRTMQELVRAWHALAADAAAPAKVHFLVVSFDPEFDTPQVLRAYGQSHGVPEEGWTLATGALIEVTALAEQFGLTFWREDGGWAHNLRTAVIGADGRVREILVGNRWTADDLAQAIRKALAAEKPAMP